MVEKLYNWMMKKAESKHAALVLVLISFIESSFFPLPPDPVLAIVVAKNKNRSLYYAAICSLASVLGGFLGYYIGYGCFEMIGSSILNFYGQMDKFNDLVQSGTISKWAFWIICAKGLTPIPYKIVTIASGFAKVDLATFALASVITRSTRFFVLSLICKKYGECILNFIEKNKKIALIIIIVSVAVGFLLLKLFL
ncbi:MAG: DedA family protein [Holosporaceae bacterium]|jgi:membrane protein YqaA with SNARE-associated domain|nr:DedA family protein [Holosporaceae bacterium]